jgi:YVTN family beta-propeller protein
LAILAEHRYCIPLNMNFVVFVRRVLLLSFFTSLAATPAQARAPILENFASTSSSVGRTSSNQFETPVNQRLTPAGMLIELGDMRPQALALSPDQRILVTAGITHELVVLDAATGKILQHVPLPKDTAATPATAPVSPQVLATDFDAQLSFTGLAFSPDGARIYMANVNGDIKVFAAQNDAVNPLAAWPLPEAKAPRRAAEIPAGLAVSPDGKRLYVALNLSNRLMEMDALTGNVLRLWEVGVEPYAVVLLGRKAYVSNWGGRRPDAQSLTGPAGRGTLVRVDPVHYVASEGSVSVVPLDGSDKPAEILTGLHACALAATPNGRFLVVANAGSDTLSVIDTRSDTIIETICARQSPGDLFGAQPNALAFDKNGKTLYVCNGTQNAVAVIKFNPGQSKLLGLIPVGWFPGAIIYDAALRAIGVANIKGFTLGRGNKTTGDREYNALQFRGSISLVPAPNARRLEGLTQSALANMRYPLLAAAKLPPRDGQAPRPVPERVGEPSLLKHVIYIIKENRTYDQVLGDLKEGAGDPSLCIFGQQVTPNEHKIARDFVLLDNTYCCGSKSADGHQWTDSAIATDYMEKSFAGFPRSYPAAGDKNGEDALAYSPAGFIWDDVVAHGKTLRDFGEYTTDIRRWTEAGHKGSPSYLDVYHDMVNGTHKVAVWSEPSIESVRPFMDTNAVGFDLNVPDVFRAAEFSEAIQKYERAGDLPAFNIMWLSSDHTSGTRQGTPTPAALVADNDLAVGRIIEAVSHSAFWKDTCVFVIEDDPQSGWDHVSGYRTTAYVASPYTKRGQTVRTQYNQTSMVRTMELILGLPPMNQMDATATPMFDCFVDQPDFTPFNAVSNNVPLDQVNPAPKKISDRVLRKDAYISARLPFDKEDQCPDDVLNHILWRAVKGSSVPYPDWAVKTVDDD